MGLRLPAGSCLLSFRCFGQSRYLGDRHTVDKWRVHMWGGSASIYPFPFPIVTCSQMNTIFQNQWIHPDCPWRNSVWKTKQPRWKNKDYLKSIPEMATLTDQSEDTSPNLHPNFSSSQSFPLKNIQCMLPEWAAYGPMNKNVCPDQSSQRRFWSQPNNYMYIIDIDHTWYHSYCYFWQKRGHGREMQGAFAFYIFQHLSKVLLR